MPVHLHRDGRIGHLVLDRPEKLNALDPDMREDLIAKLKQVAADDELRCLVISGTGRGFCSGADVVKMGGKRDILESRRTIQRNAHTYIKLIHALEIPVIAAVRGPAAGVGWSIALAADYIIAAQSARFVATFTTLGLAPDGGLVWFLSRLTSQMKARDIVFRARSIGADEADRLGLVTQVVPDEQLKATVDALATELSQSASFAIGLAKRQFQAAMQASLEGFLELETFTQPTLFASADSKEGVSAFREKRRPEFSGR